MKKISNEELLKEMIQMKQQLKDYENQNLKLNQKIKQLRIELQIKNKEIGQIEINSQRTKYKTYISNNNNFKTFSKDNISNVSISTNNNNINNINNNNYTFRNIKNKKRQKSQSSNSSSQLYSRSISKIKEEKKIPFERLKVQEKLDEYKKLLDKKLNEMTRNKNTHLIKTNHNRSSSYIFPKEKSIDKEISSNKNKGLSHRITDLNLRIMKGSEKKNKIGNKKKYINKSMIMLKNSFSQINYNQRNNKLIKKRYIPHIENKENLSNHNINNNMSTNNNNNNSSKSNITLRQFIFSKCSTTTSIKTQPKI
jgi:hypothetical protein